jgi:hypothetical protein
MAGSDRALFRLQNVIRTSLFACGHPRKVWLFDHPQRRSFSPYYPAILFATISGGIRPGVLTGAVGGALGFGFNFGEPVSSTAKTSLEHDAIRHAHSLSFGNSWRIRRV